MTVEFIKSGPDTWTSRSNAYVIVKEPNGWYTVRNGYGAYLASERSLALAKTFADEHLRGDYA